MNSKSNTVDMPLTDCEFMSSRVVSAPRELVFKAFTDPKHLIHWWGPKGFLNTFVECNPQPGGQWRFIMHGPDGQDYKNESVFVEVSPERVVLQHLSSPRFQLTASFNDESGKTKVSWRMRFETAEECARVKTYALPANEQNFDKLEAELTKMTAGESTAVFSRTFDAPRDLVWKAWTERDRLMEWFGPKGFTMSVAKLDFRPGGTFHYSLRAANGHEMWGKFVYREIVAPQRIVLVNSFSNAAGELTRHPMAATWPLEMLSTTTLAQHEGKTILTIRWEPLNANAEERKTFAGAHEGMKQGWNGTFDQLAAYLAKTK